MNDQPKDPVPGAEAGTGQGVNVSVREDPDRSRVGTDSRGPRSKKLQKIPSHFWLHVHDGCEERRYAHPPKDIPVTRVDVVIDEHTGRPVDEVRSPYVFFEQPRYPDGDLPPRKYVVPRGSGWQLLYHDDGDGASYWRRPHLHGEVLP